VKIRHKNLTIVRNFKKLIPRLLYYSLMNLYGYAIMCKFWSIVVKMLWIGVRELTESAVHIPWSATCR